MNAAAYTAAAIVALAGLVVLGIPLWAIAGHLTDVNTSLRRLADVLSAQNVHYGIPTTPAALAAGVIADDELKRQVNADDPPAP